ncbi:MAG: hypothetical protein ACYDDE_05040 [bacterium]
MKKFILILSLLTLTLTITACAKKTTGTKTVINNQPVKIKAKTVNKSRLSIYGLNLKGSKRPAIEKVLNKHGFNPIKVGSKYFCDKYGISGQIKGAKRLYVCFTSNNTFAYAEYIFPSFINPALVTHVIRIVADKYGHNFSKNGKASLGDVTAVWNTGDGTEVKVYRGWPSTDVYLYLIDINKKNKLANEISAIKRAKEKNQSKKESSAF